MMIFNSIRPGQGLPQRRPHNSNTGARNGAEWSTAEIDRLRALVTEGLSTAQMANTLALEGYPPRTRNAVIGKCLRLEINISRGRSPVATVARLPRETKPRPPRPPRPPVMEMKPVSEPPVKVAPKGWPKPATETQVWYLEDKMFERCRMPLWGDHEPIESRFYCGAPTVDGTSYCSACRAITLVKPVPQHKARGLGKAVRP